MKLPNMPDNLKRKVSKAARENFDKYNNEFGYLEPTNLFNAAYLHGFNLAHNIYDVAEERDRIFKKHGPVPTKDFPTPSSRALDGAQKYLQQNQIPDDDYEEIYTTGYRQGFEAALNEFADEPFDNEMYQIVDYYLSGNMPKR